MAEAILLASEQERATQRERLVRILLEAILRHDLAFLASEDAREMAELLYD